MALIHEKIIAILADSDAIAKDKRNQSQGFNFRGIDDVYNSLHPLLAKHGVFSTTQVLAERSEERQTANGGTLIYRILTVKFTFYAADGSNVESVMIGEGMDSGDKASNKAMAIAHKYALLQLLAIPTEDAKDPDADSHNVAPKTTPPTQPLDDQHPIGKTNEEGARQRSLDLIKSENIDIATRDAIFAKHGGKSEMGKDGKNHWTGIIWLEVLTDLIARQRAPAMDASAEAQIDAIFNGNVPA
jgi:hypothetical protein